MLKLAVIHPFGDYGRGHPITDHDEIIEVLKGENAHHVVASGSPDEIGSARAEAKQNAEPEKVADHE